MPSYGNFQVSCENGQTVLRFAEQIYNRIRILYFTLKIDIDNIARFRYRNGYGKGKPHEAPEKPACMPAQPIPARPWPDIAVAARMAARSVFRGNIGNADEIRVCIRHRW